MAPELLVFPGNPEDELIPYKGLQFRTKEFSDVVFEFVMGEGQSQSDEAEGCVRRVHVQAPLTAKTKDMAKARHRLMMGWMRLTRCAAPWGGVTSVHGTAAGLVASVLVISLLSSGCATLRQAVIYPTARVESVKLANVGLDAATIEFTIGVDNPYSVTLPVAGLDFALSVKEREFLEGRADLDRVIRAHETGRLSVPVRVPFIKIYELASDLQLGSTIGYHADLGLRVTTPIAGEISLPLDADGEIKLPGR